MAIDAEKSEIHQLDEHQRREESLDPQKPHQIVHIENFQVLGLDPDDAEFYTTFPAEARARVIHKVDIRLVPMLAVLYLISHIDRANIGVSCSKSYEFWFWEWMVG